MRSLISAIHDIVKHLREDIVYQITASRLVMIAEIPVPQERVREFLIIHDRALREKRVNRRWRWFEQEHEYRLGSYDMWKFFREIYPSMPDEVRDAAISFRTSCCATVSFYTYR